MGIIGLWDVLGEGEVWHVADYAADFFVKYNRPLRIAVDEACWRFRNLNANQVEQMRNDESAANPIEKVILQRIYRLLRLNIQLIFVDDGLRRPHKRGKAGGGKLDYELKKLTRQLLSQLKVPHHEAPGEAEAECARMQALGIVDAVWSDDGDSFMFGCGTLIKQHKIGNKNVKDHVRIYYAEEIKRKHDLDSESLVLFALLAGGDYLKGGLYGCGPKTAAMISQRRVGLANSLCHAERPALVRWREQLESALRPHGKVDVPWNFPDFKALNNYRSPTISTDEQLSNLRGLRNGWDQKFDQRGLRVFLRHMFNFSTREFLKHIMPILVARRLARATRDQKTENVELGIRLKRTRKRKGREGVAEPQAKSEVRILFSPTSVVELDLSSCPPEEDWTKFAAKDGTPYDARSAVECELLECILKHGLPEGALFEESHPATRRKRKADSQENDADQPSASKKKPRSPPSGGAIRSQTAKRTEPRNKSSDSISNARTEPTKERRSRRSKDKAAVQEDVERSRSPPPAIFQLPEGLQELKADAGVVDLCDDDDSASDAEDNAEDAELALAIRMSLSEVLPLNGPMMQPHVTLASHGTVNTAIPNILNHSATASGSARDSPKANMSNARTAPIYDQPPRSNPQHHNQGSQVPPERLVPGQAISTQTLRDLRLHSSLLKAIESPQTSKSVLRPPDTGTSSMQKSVEVIDLT